MQCTSVPNHFQFKDFLLTCWLRLERAESDPHCSSLEGARGSNFCKANEIKNLSDKCKQNLFDFPNSRQFDVKVYAHFKCKLCVIHFSIFFTYSKSILLETNILECKQLMLIVSFWAYFFPFRTAIHKVK